MIEIAIALTVTLIAFETKAWFPSVLHKLIVLATMRLPRRQRSRFREEWTAHLQEVPGGVAKLWQALGFVWASGRMFPRWSHAVSQKRSLARSEIASRMTVRALDLFMVIPAIVVLAPLLAIITGISAFGGPAMFTVARYGKRGRMIHLYKFRTMALARHVDGFPVINRWGRFLRITSLDEIPQLFNVLKGDLSLIGPSPKPFPGGDEKPGLSSAFALADDTRVRAAQSVLARVFWTILFYFRTLFRVVRLVFCSTWGAEKVEQSDD